MRCDHCGGPIHPARLEAIPHTVTCSHRCSTKRIARRWSEHGRRWKRGETDRDGWSEAWKKVNEGK